MPVPLVVWIHCEPGDRVSIAGLAALVGAVAARGGHATIGLSPAYAAAVAPSLVASWAAAGHQIGAHHHGYFARDLPAGWDGYSDTGAAAVHPDTRGGMADFANRLAGVGVFADVASVASAGFDWVASATHEVTGGAARSAPMPATHGTYLVTQITSAPLGVGQSATVAAHIASEVALCLPSQVVCVACHAHEISAGELGVVLDAAIAAGAVIVRAAQAIAEAAP